MDILQNDQERNFGTTYPFGLLAGRALVEQHTYIYEELP